MAAARPRAELSSILSALDDLSTRVTGIADRTERTQLDWLSSELYEAERALGEARRRLSRAVERLR